MTYYERKTVRLGRAGGSSTIVLPKSWLEEMSVQDRVDLIRIEGGIMIAPTVESVQSIEDEPEFAQFLDFMMRSALTHPQTLVNAVTFMTGDDDLFDGVELDIDGVTDDPGLPVTATPSIAR